MSVDIAPFSLPVRVAEQDLAACVDILLENVFAHTAEGTAFSVRVSPRTAGGAWLVVSDSGLGFSHPDPAQRGLSSAVTIGLGPAERLARMPRRHIKSRRIEHDLAADDEDSVFRSAGAIPDPLTPAHLGAPRRPSRQIVSRYRTCVRLTVTMAS